MCQVVRIPATVRSIKLQAALIGPASLRHDRTRCPRARNWREILGSDLEQLLTLLRFPCLPTPKHRSRGPRRSAEAAECAEGGTQAVQRAAGCRRSGRLTQFRIFELSPDVFLSVLCGLCASHRFRESDGLSVVSPRRRGRPTSRPTIPPHAKWGPHRMGTHLRIAPMRRRGRL